jgi:hypothetical protein
VASYLFNFLQKISRYHEVTQMNAQNLAIVFAPNILVSNDTDDIRRLREAPLIGKVTIFLFVFFLSFSFWDYFDSNRLGDENSD